MKHSVKFLGLIAMPLALITSCSKDELVSSYKGEEISFNTRLATRATETNLNTLDAFKVYADAEGYSTMFINGETAKKEGTGNKYILKKEDGSSFFWPADVHSIKFWAYGPAGGKNDFTDIETVAINASSQELRKIKPEANTTEGGKNHKDLVVAYNEVARSSANGMAVELNFNHALSKINVSVKNGEQKDRKIYIKGAWLMSVYSTGTLNFKDTKPENLSAPNVYKNNMLWQPEDNSFADYGLIKDGVPSDGSLLDISKTDYESVIGVKNSDLMLIPQGRAAYDFKKPTEGGAYLLFLCRVEAIHPGSTHTSDEDPEAKADETHSHQLFPASETFNQNEFGYTCVPVAINWEPGISYTYRVTFCGPNSGAGVYPPDVEMPTVSGVTIINMPQGKNPGDPVLDQPISFDVKVAGWEQAANNDMNLQ